MQQSIYGNHAAQHLQVDVQMRSFMARAYSRNATSQRHRKHDERSVALQRRRPSRSQLDDLVGENVHFKRLEIVEFLQAHTNVHTPTSQLRVRPHRESSAQEVRMRFTHVPYYISCGCCCSNSNSCISVADANLCH